MRWDRLKKPWSKEQCRRRYVECGDKIGIRGLAALSGIPKGTLEHWVRNELWVQQRDKYEDALKTATQEKIVEKTSEKLSDEISVVIVENYKVHKLARDYAAKMIESKAMQLSQDLKIQHSKERQAAIARHSAVEANSWSQMLKRSTDAINEIKGIKYFTDLNAAADKLQREGFEIVDPSEENKDDE